MTEVDRSKWEEARLIPVSGIEGTKEQENRATSALLAVMRAVPDFARDILKDVNAPLQKRSKINTYFQTYFQLGERKVVPDGVIEVDNHGTTWTLLLEVKTGDSKLEREQLEDYLDVAKTYNLSGVLTISNQIAAVPEIHPTMVDKRKLKTTTLSHISWSEILQSAMVRKNFIGVDDSDQAWILEELIRYLKFEKSGAAGFKNMGPSWVAVRDAVANKTLRAHDKSAEEVVEHFDTLMRWVSIKLTSSIGLRVSPIYSRAELEDDSIRIQNGVQELCENGILYSSLRIPNTVSPMTIKADLRLEKIFCWFEISAPGGFQKESAKINWLTRQLKNSAETVQLEAFVKRQHDGITATLPAAVADPKILVPEGGKEISRFEVKESFKMGRHGNNIPDKSFISSMLTAVQFTYDEIGQKLKNWTPAPTPRLSLPKPDPMDAITIRQPVIKKEESIDEYALP